MGILGPIAANPTEQRSRQISALNRKDHSQWEKTGKPNRVDGVSADILSAPKTPRENGVVVKGAGWGTHGYGEGQPFMYLRRDYVGAPLAEGEPDRNVLFRVDEWGGIGTAGGIHVATGYRTPDRFPQVDLGIWIDAAVDAHGLIIDSVNDAPLKYWILCRTNSGGTIFQVTPLGQAAVHSINTSTFGAMTVGVGPGGSQSTHGVGALANEIVGGSAANDTVVRAQSLAYNFYFGSGATDLWQTYRANGGYVRLGHAASSHYALYQSNVGWTVVGAIAGQKISFYLGGTEYAFQDAFRFKFNTGLQLESIGGSDPGTPSGNSAYLFINEIGGVQRLRVKFDNGTRKTLADDTGGST